jgi:hypothetical protein
MGPIILFDKSILQALSVDESVLFDNFFMSNICPIFYVETLADLEKAVRLGRTPEQEVGLLAAKTPQMHSYPNMFHHQLCISNLLGYPVAMDGRPLLSGGKPVKTKDQSGIVFDEAPEALAFSRWQAGKFLEVEREMDSYQPDSIGHKVVKLVKTSGDRASWIFSDADTTKYYQASDIFVLPSERGNAQCAF